jgi:hypothetical protein
MTRYFGILNSCCYMPLRMRANTPFATLHRDSHEGSDTGSRQPYKTF